MSQSPPTESENMQQFLPDRGVSHKAGKTIQEGVRCPKCGYDLRGVRVGDPCPECGRSTRRITRMQSAADLDDDFLRNVRLGVRLIAVSWILIIPPPIVSVFTHMPMSLIFWLMDIGLLLAVVGSFLLVSRTAYASAAGARMTLAERLTIITPTLALAFMGYAHYKMEQSMGGIAPPALLTLGFISIVVSHVTICTVAEGHARRLEDESLGDKFWALAWAIPLAGVIGVPIGAWMLGGTVMVICLAGLFFTLAFYIAELALFFFLLRLSRLATWTLRYQSEYAERSDRLRAQRESRQGAPGT